MSFALQTDRLTLRRPAASDAPAIARHANDIEVARWLLTMPHPYTLADAEQWIAAQQASTSPGASCVIDLEGEAIGAIGTKGEFGYWLGRAHWGQGYVLEAARALIDHHFTNGGGDLRSSYALDNPKSGRIQAACGFTPTGEEDHRKGIMPQQDHIHRQTSLTRAAWEAAA